MGQHSAQTRPAKIRYHDPTLSCDVARVYAYRAYCACGWTGPRRDRHIEARNDAKIHRAEMMIAQSVSATGGTEAS